MTKSVLLVLIVLVASSCASRRDIASSPQENVQSEHKAFQHAQMTDGAASRIR